MEVIKDLNLTYEVKKTNMHLKKNNFTLNHSERPLNKFNYNFIFIYFLKFDSLFSVDNIHLVINILIQINLTKIYLTNFAKR